MGDQRTAYQRSIDDLGQCAHALLDVAAKTVAPDAEVVNLDAYAQAQALRAKLAPLAAMCALSGESRGVAVLDAMLGLGLDPVASAVGKDIDHVESEVQIAGRGRVDRAVIHRSGRLSIIEVKDSATLRDVVAGIGQVLLYKGMLERTTSWDPIVPMLAVLHEHDPDVARACALAGVTYLPMGDVRWTRAVSQLVHLSLYGAA